MYLHSTDDYDFSFFYKNLPDSFVSDLKIVPPMGLGPLFIHVQYYVDVAM